MYDRDLGRLRDAMNLVCLKALTRDQLASQLMTMGLEGRDTSFVRRRLRKIPAEVELAEAQLHALTVLMSERHKVHLVW